MFSFVSSVGATPRRSPAPHTRARKKDTDATPQSRETKQTLNPKPQAPQHPVSGREKACLSTRPLASWANGLRTPRPCAAWVVYHPRPRTHAAAGTGGLAECEKDSRNAVFLVFLVAQWIFKAPVYGPTGYQHISDGITTHIKRETPEGSKVLGV